MKNFSIERGGITSLMSMKEIMEIITPSCALKLFDLMDLYNKVPVQFLEEPYNGYLRHSAIVSGPVYEADTVPGVYCVELVWTIPVVTKATVKAKNLELANVITPHIIEENCDNIYSDMSEALESFIPDMNHVGIRDIMPVYKRAYPDIQNYIINPEERK